MSPDDRRAARLRWRCRRGTKELDVIMERFVASGALERASPVELDHLELLLALSDPELFGLLSGRERATDPALQNAVAAVLGGDHHQASG